ncbi:phage tail tape measure protein [Streptomyces sp. NPDC006540]|uniref:phage tail tape measure protein n=1 Tax=Streptomyces sp. NPDC006540 TaxID=3155353 RepID=UPI0033AAC942
MPAPEIAVAYVSIVPSLQGFQGDLRSQLVGPTEDAGAEAGGKFSAALKAGLAAGAAVAGAVLVKGITDAIEQSGIRSRLQAQLGATDKDAARYGKVAGKLFSKGITENFQQAADAVRAVAQSGLLPPTATNAQLEQIAKKAADVAGVFDQEMGSVANAVSQMMKTGLVKDATEGFDVLTKGFQNGADKAGDLLDTFNEYSVQFQKLGLDGKTALGLLTQGIGAGARDADIAADAFKEFSIRAVDGSKTSADAYKAMGLNGAAMTAQIAKGGDNARAGLQTVLDKLRAMSDPVAREAAAVGIFGTQAEDLGKALFALDPSKAESALGVVDGAASKLGATIHSGPTHEFEVLMRTAQQGLADAMTKHVLPVIADLIHGLIDLGKWAAGAWQWIKDVSPYLAPFAVLVGGLTLAMNAQAIAVGAVTAVFAVYRAAMLVGIAVVNGMAIAQGLLNAVMALNPITLVVIAIAALVAGLIVAYNKSETFRNIVQTAFKAVGDAALWLWEKAIKPALGFIGELFHWLYTIIAVIVLAPLIILFEALGAVVGWLWDTIIEPVFKFISDAAMLMWEGALKPAFESAEKAFNTVGDALEMVWKEYIKPALQDIGDKATWLWEEAIKPAFDFIKEGADLVGESFGKAKDYIKEQWDKLQDIAKKPVRWIIDTVYNAGIVPLWNKVAGAVGGKKLEKLQLGDWGKAQGGILPGTSSWRNGDDQLVPMRRGEGVYVSEAMKDPYERARLFAVNKAAMRGQSLSAFREPGFAKGGILGTVGNLASGAWDWTKDTVGGLLGHGFDALKDLIQSGLPAADTGWGRLMRGVPMSIFDSLTTFGKKKEESFTGGAGVKSALAWARTQVGKPYQWGGAGNPSWDCSGFMSGIQKKITGQDPRGRLWSTFSFQGDKAPAGWVRGLKSPFQIGITNQGVGHTAGTLGGVNVESRGGAGVLVGSKARGANSMLFQDVYGYAPARKYDNGGWLQPGATQTVNHTGKPEAVLTNPQWEAISRLAAQGGGIADGTRLVLVTDGGSFEAYVDGRADGQIKRTLVDPAQSGRAL